MLALIERRYVSASKDEREGEMTHRYRRNLLQYVAVCCSMLYYIAVCCSAWCGRDAL